MTSPRPFVRKTVAASAIAAVCLLYVSPLGRAQTPQTPPAPDNPNVFRGGTTLVPIDVRIVDGKGKPVTDLTQADFTVLENGTMQAIRHFSTQAFTPEAPSATDVLHIRTAQSNTIDPQNRRVFLIVLGRGRLQPPAKGLDGMLHFVNDLLMPQDLVGVVGWDRATEFTTDHAKIAGILDRYKQANDDIEGKLKLAISGLAAIYGSKGIPDNLRKEIDGVFGGPAGSHGIRTVELGQSPNAVRMGTDNKDTMDAMLDALSDDIDGTGTVNSDLDELAAANATTMQDLGKLYLAIEFLRHVDGEKHVVFVSESGLILPRVEDDKDLAATATDARVVIDYVHTGGVHTMGTVYNATASRAAAPARLAPARPGAPIARGRVGGQPKQQLDQWTFATARTVTSLTGGRFFAGQLPNAAADMDAIDLASRFQYTLGYYPSNPKLDGSYRHIVVRVNRPGLQVLYRHGYYANERIAPYDRERAVTYSRISAAASYDQPVNDIPLQATVSQAKPPAALSVQVQIKINPTPLSFEKVRGHNVDAVDVATFCVNDKDQLVGQDWKTVQLNYTDERLPAVMHDGVSVDFTVPLDAPAKNVKIIVYDYRADLIGSAIIKAQ